MTVDVSRRHYDEDDLPPELQDPEQIDPALAPIYEQMKPIFEELDREYKQQQKKLDEIREKRTKIEKSMKALLTGQPATKIKDTAVKTSHDWKPSENLRVKVLDALRKAGPDGLTVSEGAKATGLSTTAVDKVMRYFRGDQIRMAGKRNNATLYKMMDSNGADS